MTDTTKLQDAVRRIADRLEAIGHSSRAIAVRHTLERMEDADIVEQRPVSAVNCDCGQPAKYHPVIGLGIVPLCEDCYANEFPERAATFALARLNPRAAEFRDPALRTVPSGYNVTG